MTTGTGRADAGAEGGRDLLILAMDQRDSIEQKLFGIDGTPSPADAARIADAKLLIYRALVDAIAELPDTVQPGVLVDEQYGGSVLELAGAAGDVVNLAAPLEKSGQEWFDFEYGDAWQEHAAFFRTDHTKVLIRDNPGLDPAERTEQARKLATVADWCRSTKRSFLLELLVPATDDDLASVDGDTDRYDDEVRPGLTVAALEFLQDAGVTPDLWKIEGLNASDDAERIAATARRGGLDARCIVLGRHAPQEALDHWLQVAAPVDGFVGFAIGRSNWWDPLSQRLAGDLGAKKTQRAIADNYLHYAKTWVAARSH